MTRAARAIPGFQEPVCHFEVMRDDQVRVSSTQFCGGLWSWRLCGMAGDVLAQSIGYATEADCRRALAQLRRHAAGAFTQEP